MDTHIEAYLVAACRYDTKIQGPSWKVVKGTNRLVQA